MIIIEINDGLGNQLFKYAVGFALAQKHHVPLKMEKHWFTHETNASFRQYQLHHFNISAEDASYEEIDEFINKDTFFHRLFTPYYKRARVYEKATKYDSNFDKIPAHTYLLGYWQSWRYFNTYKLKLLKEFALITPPKEVALPYLRLVENENSVGIHIRRGDYVSNPTFNVLTMDYYREAVLYLKGKHTNLIWFVFSDDLSWAREHMDFLDNPVFVAGLSDIDDFRLLNLCRHHIIANSTFSWWAAYLKPSNEGVVIAPKVPFQTDTLQAPADFFPPDFTLI